MREATKPQKGDFFLIPYTATYDKPRYGTRVGIFHQRKPIGCQLHGDIYAAQWVFKLAPDDNSPEIIVTVDADDSGKVTANELELLYTKIKRFR